MVVILRVAFSYVFAFCCSYYWFLEVKLRLYWTLSLNWWQSWIHPEWSLTCFSCRCNCSAEELVKSISMAKEMLNAFRIVPLHVNEFWVHESLCQFYMTIIISITCGQMNISITKLLWSLFKVMKLKIL